MKVFKKFNSLLRQFYGPLPVATYVAIITTTVVLPLRSPLCSKNTQYNRRPHPRAAINISGALPPRKTSAGAALALGHAGGAKYLVGATIFYGWKIAKLASVHIKIGGGTIEKRSGEVLSSAHTEVIFPVQLAICSHSPRVCPGLDFYVSLVPGVGYGTMIQNHPLKIINHSLNLIAGASLESIRTYGKMDAGVRFGMFFYFDVIKDNKDYDPWLAYTIFELGVIIRWGEG